MRYVYEATPSPDGEGWCCQPGYPTCDCGYFGGFVHDRCACGFVGAGEINPYGACDLAPPDWVRQTDAHGCDFYTSRWPTTACCNCFDEDAGIDGGGEDAGADAVDASPAGI